MIQPSDADFSQVEEKEDHLKVAVVGLVDLLVVVHHLRTAMITTKALEISEPPRWTTLWNMPIQPKQY